MFQDRVQVQFLNEVLDLPANLSTTVENLISKVLKQKVFPSKNRRSSWHQKFALISRSTTSLAIERIVEDFEFIKDVLSPGTSFHLEEIPFKYEFLRRPQLVFHSEVASRPSKTYHPSHHGEVIQAYIRSSKQLDYKDNAGSELELRQTLRWSHVIPSDLKQQSQNPSAFTNFPSLGKILSDSWNESEFLLRADQKLGGVVMYREAKKAASEADGPDSFFVYAILSECEVNFAIKKSNGNKNNVFYIVFTPKTRACEYLSIDENQKTTYKTIMIEKRRDFVAWISGLRLAKFGERLRTAFNFTPVATTSMALPNRIKTNQSQSVQVQANIRRAGAGSTSSSWSESTSSLSTWSIISSDSSSNNTNTVSTLKPKQMCAMLSDVVCEAEQDDLGQADEEEEPIFAPLDILESGSEKKPNSETPERPKQLCAILSDVPYEPDASEICDEFHEEPIYVPLDMSGPEAKIVTDKDEIRKIKEDEAFTSSYRNPALRNTALPFNEPWFTRQGKFEVDRILNQRYNIDGVFLVRPSNYRDPSEPFAPTFTLCLLYQESIHYYRILQRWLFDKMVFTLDDGLTNFSTISALIDFYRINVTKTLPCILTENPIVIVK